MRNTLVACLLAILPAGVFASDDGSQFASPFRINYLGYLQNGPKVAVYLAPAPGTTAWALKDASGGIVAKGETSDFVANDFASGDSFFRIDFSGFKGTGHPHPFSTTSIRQGSTASA